jgi:hypothetical protein
MAEMDSAAERHGKAYQDALGEDGQMKVDEFQGQGVESTEAQLFAFSPKMSYPSPKWVEADPDF